MKQYEKYKDSGIEWLGEIPEHWSLRNLEVVARKDRYSITGGPFGSDLKNGEYTEKGVRIIQLQNIGVGEFRNDYKIFTSEDKANQLSSCNIFPGEIIIAKMADPVARACIIPDFDERYIMASDGIRLEVDTEQFNVKFIEYSINSKYFNFQAELNSTGTTRLRIGLSTLKKLKIILPSLVEQHQIADFINHHTSILNQLITEKESLISKLQEKRKALINEAVTKGLNPNAPMRDSGIEWLGMIPAHWGVNELKRYVDFVQTGTTPSTEKREYFENPTFNWFTPSDFYDNNIYLKESKRKVSEVAVNEQACRVFPENTVLLIGIGATLGKVGISQNICSANQQINAIIFNQNINPVFGAYYLSSIKEIIVSMANAATLAILNQSNTKEIPITCPPIKEQADIVNFIESRTTKIDEIVSETQLQIHKLKEYKTAVISEVVTGKVDVREWKPRSG